MLEQTEWSEHELGDLFEKLTLKFNKKPFDKINDISKDQNKEFDLPLVNAKFGDNGIMYYGRSSDFDSVEMTIDIVNDGAISTGKVYPQPQRTGVLYNAYLIKPKNVVTRNQLIFFSKCIEKSIQLKYGYENKAGWEKVKKEKIKLPQKEGKIDYQFMENFIAELEQARIAELEAYLIATGLNDYILTNKECAVLEAFRQDKKIQWLEFNIGQLFDILTYKKRFDANKVEVLDAGHPYVVRTALNNGVKGYLLEDEQYLNDGNTISFGQDTATMFYQEKPYFTGDKIKIVKSKFEGFNKIIAMYFITTMGKAFSNFSWGSSSFSVKSIESQKIMLPSKDGIPDFEFMMTFISAIQKLVIKDVVLYADAKIEATKKVVN